MKYYKTEKIVAIIFNRSLYLLSLIYEKAWVKSDPISVGRLRGVSNFRYPKTRSTTRSICFTIMKVDTACVAVAPDNICKTETGTPGTSSCNFSAKRKSG